MQWSVPSAQSGNCPIPTISPMGSDLVIAFHVPTENPPNTATTMKNRRILGRLVTRKLDIFSHRTASPPRRWRLKFLIVPGKARNLDRISLQYKMA